MSHLFPSPYTTVNPLPDTSFPVPQTKNLPSSPLTLLEPFIIEFGALIVVSGGFVTSIIMQLLQSIKSPIVHPLLPKMIALEAPGPVPSLPPILKSSSASELLRPILPPIIMPGIPCRITPELSYPSSPPVAILINASL